MNDITKSDFDYSVVSTDTAHKLQSLSNQLDGIYQNYSVVVGEVLYQAQQELAGYGNGVFGQWVESKGISKSNSYNYINAYKFVQQLDKPQDKEIFLSQPQRLKNEMSKPSAIPDVNQAVFDGDITTHKQYKELERQLKLTQADSEKLRQKTEEQAEQILDLNTKQSQVIEKEVIKEVVPDDYQFFKSNYEASERNNEFYKQQNSELREEMKELERIIKEQQKNKASREELADLEEHKRAISFELDSLEKIVALNEAVETFLTTHASLQYSSDFSNLYNNRDLTLSLLDTINRLEKWIDDIKSELPKSEIIEGE